MEELNNVAANTEEVAAPQEDVNLEQSEQQEESLDNQEVQQDNQEQDITQTQKFAHRLKEEKARARDELIAEMYGESHGIHTYEQYQQALAEAQEAERRKYYQEKGVDPDLINQAIEEHPDVQYARQMKAKEEADRKFQQEVDQLLQEFPDLKPKDIPQEVFDLNKQGVPLLYAYKSATYGHLKTQTEQETIRKLSANATSSPGSLGEGAEVQRASVKDMSKADFEAMIARVKRGEQIKL